MIFNITLNTHRLVILQFRITQSASNPIEILGLIGFGKLSIIYSADYSYSLKVQFGPFTVLCTAGTLSVWRLHGRKLYSVRRDEQAH